MTASPRIRVGPTGWAVLSAIVACGIVLLVRTHDAPLLLAMLLGLMTASAMLLRPEIATLAVVFLLYTNIPIVAYQHHGVPMAVAGSFILLLALPLVHYVVLRREPLRVDTTFLLMLLFLAVFLLSAFFATEAPIASERIQTYVLEGLLLYLLLFNAIRRVATLQRVVWAMLAAGTLLGGLTLYQVVTGSYEQQFGGLAQRQDEITGELQSGPTTANKGGLRVYQREHRARGPVDDPNRYAQIMIVLLPLAVVQVRNGRSRRTRLFGATAGIFILAGVLFTYSRGAFLTLALLAFAMAFVKWVRPLPFCIFVLCVVSLILRFAPGVYQRIGSISAVSAMVSGDRSVQADGAIRGRATEMLAALHVFRDHPVLGVGPGQYAPVYSVRYQQMPGIQFRDLRIPRRAHSLYFELAAELGVIGVAVFTVIVLLLLRSLWRARREWAGRSAEFADLATGLWLSIIAYLGTGMFLHLSYERYLWCLLAIAGATLHVFRSQAVREERAVTTNRATQVPLPVFALQPGEILPGSRPTSRS